MNWFFLALLAPVLWSLVNHADKYLLSKYFAHRGVGTLMIYSSLIAAVVLPVFYFLSPAVLAITNFSKIILILSGIIYAFFTLFYFFALNEEDASTVMPLFLTLPIFGFILSYFFLGETLTRGEVIASLVILCGASLLSFEKNEGGFRWRSKLLFFVFLANLFYAFHDTIFKVAAVDGNFWTAIFWQHVGLLIVGLFLLLFVGSYRRDFFQTLRTSSGAIFSVNIFSELATIGGNTLTSVALILAPIAIVQTIASIQPAFVFLIGLLLTLFLPHIAEEDISRRTIIQKLAAIAIIGLGSYLLYNL